MSIIKLNLEELSKINSELSSYDSTLLSNYLPQAEEALTSIKNNVLGNELHNVISTINSQFESAKGLLTKSLPKLENFLDQQIKTYNLTEEELKENLVKVLNKMATHSKTINYTDAASSFSQYWKERGQDFKENYDFSNVNGLLSGAYEVVTGTVETAGDVFETVMDAFGPIGSGIGNVMSGFFDGTNWLMDHTIGWILN